MLKISVFESLMSFS